LQPYIGKLEAEGVIQRPGGGFLLDQNRVAYLRYLRRERRQSLQSAAASEFAAAKAELIRIRNAEKKRDLRCASRYLKPAPSWPISAASLRHDDRR
jgi:hypothetical protein